MEFAATRVLDDAEVERLCDIFGCGNNQLLAEKLRPFAEAALAEYTDMLLDPKGKRDKQLEDRLYLVIQAAGRLPDENEVKSWTGLDIAKTKTLIKNVLVKHQANLRPIIQDATRSLIENIDDSSDDDYRILITNQKALVEFLNDYLESGQIGSDMITKVRNTRNKYIMSNDEYMRLLEISTSN